MTAWPAPARRDHQSFCEKEGWEQVRNARGQTSGHHAVTYELHLHDGRILRTRICHPPDSTNYGPGLWAHILRDQLDVDEAAFWACVQGGVMPDRGEPKAPAEAFPADLMFLLVNRLHLSSAEIADMSREEAIKRMHEYWSQPHD